jgi:2-keto-4-pentenoate hydratase/2-oxohepta-3-ene-1,7-dioic acid hydratase in catechol pathway
MRLVTYDAGRGPRAGILEGGAVADVWDALGDPPDGQPSVRAVLERGREGLAGEGSVPLSEARLLPPVPDPEKIVCIGLNYQSHAQEAGLDAPATPTFFAKFRNALAAPGEDVPLPTFSGRVDYEAEVAVVIGRRCRELTEAQAMDAVAGYTLLNDLTARDYQFATPQWMPGKVFDGSAPCGPAVVTPDEAGRHDAIEVSLDLNGETMQHSTTADLVHSIPVLVAHLSRLMTLEPGDLISTGTPAGVGSTRNPRSYLQPGDTTEISSPQLGTLTTHLA